MYYAILHSGLDMFKFLLENGKYDINDKFISIYFLFYYVVMMRFCPTIYKKFAQNAQDFLEIAQKKYNHIFKNILFKKKFI